ncbi:MAG TPA: enoyl-CoA hydratase-related protein [Egibacteraceae bacterium]|nr:enoyl-CoA hydratase-related protein [Egibacteraceae bacterium]
MTGYDTLRVARDDRGVATVTMDRAEVRNAFDPALIAELTAVAAELAADGAVRVVVLTGAGSVFSAGADLNWMKAMQAYTYEENVADSRRLDAMFRALWELPQPVVGRINGHALGGGTGLTAVCDIAIASDAATFGFTEVLLGIAPAVISPYVLRKTSLSFARSVFVTGERFSAERAREAGLVHEVVAAGALDDAVEAAVRRCLAAGPTAAAAAKRLPEIALLPLDDAAAQTVEIIAGLRVAEEGQEGMAAFFDKRKPRWVSEG